MGLFNVYGLRCAGRYRRGRLRRGQPGAGAGFKAEGAGPWAGAGGGGVVGLVGFVGGGCFWLSNKINGGPRPPATVCTNNYYVMLGQHL